MKKIALLITLLVTLSINSKEPASLCNVVFGSSYQKTLEQLKNELGNPSEEDTCMITYKNKCYQGMVYQTITFKFQLDNNGKRYFNEACFSIKSPNKKLASKRLEQIAQNVRQYYPTLSRDIDDDGSWFYKGGISPVDGQSLFTIYMFRQNNIYISQLRYGPLKFSKS
jgi:hypothetical protein